MKTATYIAKILTFTACREVRPLAGTSPLEYALIGPTINWWADSYPARVEMGVYIELTDAHGTYHPRITVFDNEGEPLGDLAKGVPFVSDDPTRVHCMTLPHIAFNVPRPGLYDLVLFLNEEEAQRRQLWVLPRGRGS